MWEGEGGGALPHSQKSRHQPGTEGKQRVKGKTRKSEKRRVRLRERGTGEGGRKEGSRKQRRPMKMRRCVGKHRIPCLPL